MLSPQAIPKENPAASKDPASLHEALRGSGPQEMKNQGWFYLPKLAQPDKVKSAMKECLSCQSGHLNQP
jgi:hypothetical protein